MAALNDTSDKGVWNGWHWRFVLMTVAAIVVLQVIAKYAVHIPLVASTELAIFMVVWFVIPKARQRQVPNTLVGIGLLFIIDIILQFFLEKSYFAGAHLWPTLETDGITLVIGILLTFVYVRLNAWSERKRAEANAKRQERVTTTKTDDLLLTQKRVHRKKKRKNRG